MSKKPWHIVLSLLAMFLLMPAVTFSQEGKPSGPHPSNSKNAKTVAKPSLRSATLVSTDEVARKVAEEESSRAQSSQKASKHQKQVQTPKATGGAVLEFHPTDGPPAGSGKDTVQVKDRKKSVLKNVHGSVYGAAASAAGRGHGVGGAVGADSGDGKFSVYVEGEHNHADTPVPH